MSSKVKMMKRNDKINCGAAMRTASAVQSFEHGLLLFIISSTPDSLHLKNLGPMNKAFNESHLAVARPYYIAVTGSGDASARTATFELTYFAQKRLQDTTGKANVDRAVEEQEDVAQAIEQRLQERRERKECVEETLLEDVSETRSLSLQFWKLFEFTEQLSSLSLSLNTFKLLEEIVREYKGIGECEGKGGNPQEACGVERYQSPPLCYVGKPSFEIAAGTSHQSQIQHVTSNRNNKPVPVWGTRPCDAKDTSGYPHNAPRGFEASDVIRQAFDEVDGIMRTCVGLYKPLEACGDLQGARDALRAVPTPIEPLSDLCETSRSLVEALERREERGWSTLLLCTECKPSGCH